MKIEENIFKQNNLDGQYPEILKDNEIKKYQKASFYRKSCTMKL
jgi:hypothetical protein